MREHGVPNFGTAGDQLHARCYVVEIRDRVSAENQKLAASDGQPGVPATYFS
jgi:hypothetical protein